MSGETVYILREEGNGNLGVFYDEKKTLDFLDRYKDYLGITAPMDEIKKQLDDGETLLIVNEYMDKKFYFSDWCIDNDYGYIEI